MKNYLILTVAILAIAICLLDSFCIFFEKGTLFNLIQHIVWSILELGIATAMIVVFAQDRMDEKKLTV